MQILIYVNTKQDFKKNNTLGGIEILNYDLFNYLKKKHKLTLASNLNNRIKKNIWDIVISSNDAKIFNFVKAKRKILWLHNKLQIEKAFRKKQLIPILFNKIEAVFVSEYLKKNTSSFYNFEKSLVIPNFLPKICERTKINNSEFITKKNKFVWSVQRKKGLDNFIDIWIKKINTRYNDVEFHIFGLNNIKKNFKKYNIFFHGRVPRYKLLKFYKNSIGMICLGYDETFCLNALEGMKMGLPIFSLGKTNLKTLVKNNLNGFKVKKLEQIDKPIKKYLKLNNRNKKKIMKSSIAFASQYDSKNILKQWDKLIY
mgnify:CR=1 FL=1